MSIASITASMPMRCASTTSMRAAAGYMPRLRRSDFQQTMLAEAAGGRVGEHALELGALLGPTPADLLVTGSDGESALLAVGLHIAQLLAEGGLVVLGLALVGDARVDGGAAALGLLS